MKPSVMSSGSSHHEVREEAVSVGQLAASPRQRTLAGDAMPLVDTGGTWVHPRYGARDRRNRTLVLVRWVCVAPTLSAQLHLWQSIQDGSPESSRRVPDDREGARCYMCTGRAYVAR
jgi:hypothetical protein